MKRLPLFKLAWRNIWRNRRRSLITIAALAVAAGSLVWFSAFTGGFTEKMVTDTVKSGLGHIVIEPKGFLKNPQVEKRLHDPNSISAQVAECEGVKAWSPRVEARGLASSPENSMGAVIYGIDPLREKQTSIFDRSIAEGSFFSDADEYGVIIGYKMADVLKVELGDMVGVMVQNLDGEVAAEAYELVGLLRTGNPELDNGMVLLPIGQAQSLLGYKGEYSKIVVIAEDAERVDKVRQELVASVGSSQLEILTWDEISKTAYQFYQMMVAMMGFILVLLVILASFGTTNTILMSVLERVREFGVMAAIGLRPFQVFRMILYEAVSLSFFGVVCGLAIGGGISYLNTIYGIDLSIWQSATGLMGMLDPVVTFVLHPSMFAVAALTVFIIGILSAIYPGIKAARLRPVAAMRHI